MKCRQCGKDDLPLNQQSGLCVRCVIDNEAAKKKEKMIVEVIAWNLDWNRFDHDTGETELIEWIIETHKRLEGMTPETLRTLQHANSLVDEEEGEASNE
jgi:hypothetical protein